MAVRRGRGRAALAGAVRHGLVRAVQRKGGSALADARHGLKKAPGEDGVAPPGVLAAKEGHFGLCVCGSCHKRPGSVRAGVELLGLVAGQCKIKMRFCCFCFCLDTPRGLIVFRVASIQPLRCCVRCVYNVLANKSTAPLCKSEMSGTAASLTAAAATGSAAAAAPSAPAVAAAAATDASAAAATAPSRLAQMLAHNEHFVRTDFRPLVRVRGSQCGTRQTLLLTTPSRSLAAPSAFSLLHLEKL